MHLNLTIILFHLFVYDTFYMSIEKPTYCLTDTLSIINMAAVSKAIKALRIIDLNINQIVKDEQDQQHLCL